MILGRRRFARHPVALADPVAQIEEPATLSAERPPPRVDRTPPAMYATPLFGHDVSWMRMRAGGVGAPSRRTNSPDCRSSRPSCVRPGCRRSSAPRRSPPGAGGETRGAWGDGLPPPSRRRRAAACGCRRRFASTSQRDDAGPALTPAVATRCAGRPRAPARCRLPASASTGSRARLPTTATAPTLCAWLRSSPSATRSIAANVLTVRRRVPERSP